MLWLLSGAAWVQSPASAHEMVYSHQAEQVGFLLVLCLLSTLRPQKCLDLCQWEKSLINCYDSLYFSQCKGLKTIVTLFVVIVDFSLEHAGFSLVPSGFTSQLQNMSRFVVIGSDKRDFPMYLGFLPKVRSQKLYYLCQQERSLKSYDYIYFSCCKIINFKLDRTQFYY